MGIDSISESAERNPESIESSVEIAPASAVSTNVSVEAVAPLIPQYRRNLLPRNLTLSAADLKEFCELISEANERARELELRNVVLNESQTIEQAKEQINELMPVEYHYTASNDDSVYGLGIPKVNERIFPDSLKSFFVSNSSYADKAINKRPLNSVDAFFGFEKPSLKIDLITLPSNPTENRTVINVYGRDEDWVIATADRIQKFLENRRTFRPVIHGSGAYDYFVYLFLLPVILWFWGRGATYLEVWLEHKSTFYNVVLGIYALLLALLGARFLFQYLRWLFPPMEYYKSNKIGAFIHRAVIGFSALAIAGGAIYDIAKVVLKAIF